MAFRHVPLRIQDYCLLILKAVHPVTGKTYWFTDKCLPFGSSVSCKIFQDISDCIAFMVKYRTSKPVINYLDDYFFAALVKEFCEWQVNQFLAICKLIKFPVSIEKTFWCETSMTFLGYLLNAESKLVCVPIEKIVKALEMIQVFIAKKKVTVLQVQKLCGFLNFLGRCIIPGRAFTRRLYSTIAGNKKLKQHHHVRIKVENRLDLEMWEKFLQHPSIFSKNFTDFSHNDYQEIAFYSDASGNFSLGFGAWCVNEDSGVNSYIQGRWSYQFMKRHKPSIEFLELFAVTTGIMAWIENFSNMKISIFCDNESVCSMINHSSSSCRNCMVLIRMIVLKCLIHNVKIETKHVRTENNGVADALSRFQDSRFRRLAPTLYFSLQTEIPTCIWPMEKVWPTTHW